MKARIAHAQKTEQSQRFAQAHQGSASTGSSPGTVDRYNLTCLCQIFCKYPELGIFVSDFPVQEFRFIFWNLHSISPKLAVDSIQKVLVPRSELVWIFLILLVGSFILRTNSWSLNWNKPCLVWIPRDMEEGLNYSVGLDKMVIKEIQNTKVLTSGHMNHVQSDIRYVVV